MDIQELIKKNVLATIDSYNSRMSISKVVKFFERHNIFFTKTMIQNYVRVGVLPTPEEKRYYKKKHLVLLYLIDSLKKVYSLEEIKILFTPFFDDDEDIDYMVFLNYFNEQYNKTLIKESKTIETTENIFDEEQYNNFMLYLNFMAKSVAIKDMVTSTL